MNLKDQIQASFIQAMKDKDDSAKAALGSLKSKITEAEKADGNKILTDQEVIKVITNCIKQRNQSIEAFSSRKDLVEKESAEILVLEKFMPKKMSDSDIEKAIIEISATIGEMPNRNALIGKTIGAFNKKYTGQADPFKVKAIAEKLVGVSQI